MKKLIVSFIIMLAGISIYAQESDTTKIKLGDTKIIIIGKDADKDIKSKKDKLEKGKAEFEKMKSEKQSLLDDQKKELDDMKKELDAQKR